MKKVLMLLCVAALMPGLASADIIGAWSYEDAGALDRYVLTVTPTAGETMWGFDILVMDPTYSGNFVTGGGDIFKAGKDSDTSFLLDKSHSPPFPPVNDLVVASEAEGTSYLLGSFAVAGGGNYASGWSGELELLEILVDKGSLTSADLSVLDSTATSAAFVAIGDVENPTLVHLSIIPEPSTLVLLVCGLAGMLAYAWRRRK